jgi:hypothetical protein
MKKGLSIELIASLKNDFQTIYHDMMNKHNVKATLDAHYVLGEKKELLKKVSKVSESLIRYDDEDKIQKLSEYLKEV